MVRPLIDASRELFADLPGDSGLSPEQVREIVECAAAYESQGADEIVLLDVSATPQGRASNRTVVEDVRRVAREHLFPGQVAIVVVGDRAVIEQDLQAMPVTGHRKRSDKPIAGTQAVQLKLAEMARRITLAQLMSLQLGRLIRLPSTSGTSPGRARPRPPRTQRRPRRRSGAGRDPPP